YPKRLGGLEIYHQLQLGRQLHWQIGRLGAFQNLVNEIRRPAPVLSEGNAIANETAVVDMLALAIHAGEQSRYCQRRNSGTLGGKDQVREDNHELATFAR